MLRHPNIIAFKKARQRARLSRHSRPRSRRAACAPPQALLTATHLAIVMEFAAGAHPAPVPLFACALPLPCRPAPR